MISELTITRGWLEAVTERDDARLCALSDPAIRLYGGFYWSDLRAKHGRVGPISAHDGHVALTRWLEGVRLRYLAPKVAYRGNERLMVVHDTLWFDADGDVSASSESGSVFSIESGRVTSYSRYDEPDLLVRGGFRGVDPIPLKGAQA